jgi:glycosyltransferase involved in cell wall biosynthesis
MKGFENYVECTNRIERKYVLEIECRSHLLLHVAWDEQKGIIASKIYEYIASGTPIIVTPGDKGSIQEIIELSGCGICTFEVEDTFQVLEKEYRDFVNGEVKVNKTESPRVQQFSREQQTKLLAEILNGL